MRTRIEFQELLQSTLDKVLGIGVGHVYFNPPEDLILKRPCIVYNRSNPDIKYADNKIYFYTTAYDVTYITDDPEDSVVDKELIKIPYCRPGRPFPSGNAYNYPYTIYY